MENTVDNNQNEETNYFNNGIYYTIDKFIDKLDIQEIYNKIEDKYFLSNPEISDYVRKQIFLELLNDKEFVMSLIDYYNINMTEFLKILFKKYDSFIKGKFILSLRNTLSDVYSII